MMIKSLKQHPLKIGLTSLCVLLFIGLQFWERYRPLPEHGWNEKEVAQIKMSDYSDFAFAVFGDNKGNYPIFNSLLQDINRTKDVTFTIALGDLVSQAQKDSYRRFLNQARKNLSIPLITMRGNHDVSGGSALYHEIFGRSYYTFQIGQVYFIVLDATTESSFDKRQRSWLEEELKRSQPLQVRFVLMHVPPFDPRGDGFNKCLPEADRKDLIRLFTRYKVTHLFAGHIHGYFSGVWEGVPFTVTGGAGGKLQGDDPQHFLYHYVKVHVRNGKVDLSVRPIEARNGRLWLMDIVKNNLLDGSLLVATISLLALFSSIRRSHASTSLHLGESADERNRN